MEVLTEFRHVYYPDGLNSTLLPQGYVLENRTYSGNSGKNMHSKDRGDRDELLLTLVQFTGLLAVMSSQ